MNAASFITADPLNPARLCVGKMRRYFFFLHITRAPACSRTALLQNFLLTYQM